MGHSMSRERKMNRMDDLISRQAAIDAIEKLILPQVKGETAAEEINRIAWRCAINCAEEMIGHLPSAERHGRWLYDDGAMHKCSVCGELSCCTSHYCRECGAKMDGKSKCVECRGGYCEEECLK